MARLIHQIRKKPHKFNIISLTAPCDSPIINSLIGIPMLKALQMAGETAGKKIKRDTTVAMFAIGMLFFLSVDHVCCCIACNPRGEAIYLYIGSINS